MTIEFEDSIGIRETAEALLCEIEGKRIWVPKSIIHDDSEVWEEDHRGTLVLPEWFCEEKGLI